VVRTRTKHCDKCSSRRRKVSERVQATSTNTKYREIASRSSHPRRSQSLPSTRSCSKIKTGAGAFTVGVRHGTLERTRVPDETRVRSPKKRRSPYDLCSCTKSAARYTRIVQKKRQLEQTNAHSTAVKWRLQRSKWATRPCTLALRSDTCRVSIRPMCTYANQQARRRRAHTDGRRRCDGEKDVATTSRRRHVGSTSRSDAPRTPGDAKHRWHVMASHSSGGARQR